MVATILAPWLGALDHMRRVSLTKRVFTAVADSGSAKTQHNCPTRSSIDRMTLNDVLPVSE